MQKFTIRLLFAIGVFFISSTAFAQAFQIERFEPIGSTSGILNVHNSQIAPSGSVSLQLFTHFSESIFTLKHDDKVVSQPLQNKYTTEISTALSLFERFELGITLPLNYQKGDGFGTLNLNGFFLGDLRLNPKVVFRNSKRYPGFGFGLVIPTYLALGGFKGLAGYKSLRIEPRVFIDYSTPGLNIAFNLAYQKNEEQNLPGYMQSQRIRTGLAIRKHLAPRFGISASVYSDLSLDNAITAAGVPLDTLQIPAVEGLLSTQYQFSSSLKGEVGGGLGLTPVIGIPVYRVFANISLTTAVGGDQDKDGIPDSIDQCKNTPEDLDFFEDADGCPELDNDNDGIEDMKDSCENEAEDIDGYVDSDGCPDLDNDQDGILDTEDACPNKSGIAINKGCPHALGKMGGDTPKISKKLRSSQAAINQCYEDHLERNPGTSGKVVIQFTINKKGKIISTKVVRDELGKVGPCVVKIIRRITFPKPKKGEATVERTFVFDGAN